MSKSLLKPGAKAPEIKAKDQDGNEVSLADYKGKKLLLYFYPKDDTPGCTKESCNLRDNYSVLLKKGIQVLGVSIDSEKSHQKFISKYYLPFPLIADTEQKVVNAYGVWGEKSMYGKTYMGTHRVSYLIDEKGKISHVFDKVDTGNHAEQVLQALENN